MRPTKYAQDRIDQAFDDFEFAPIAVREEIALERESANVALDSYLAVIKWVFLFLPGTATLHFALMGLALFFYYGGPTIEMMVGTFGISLVAMFMVMLGVGRLTDLRYLRVVAGIVAAGALASILYSILIVFIPGDFFGWFTLLTLPLTIIIGQLLKIRTDRETSAS